MVQKPETAVLKVYHVLIGCVALTLVAVGGTCTAFADDDFPLTGNYTQNVPCKGDGTDPKAVQVKISAQQIISNMGVCTVLSTKHDGDTFTEHVECKLPAGPMMADISFTQRPDKTVDFVDSGGNYKAILHRCPN